MILDKLSGKFSAMELFMATAGHGPGRHEAVVNVILALVLVLALSAGVVMAMRSRKRSTKRSERDEGRGS
jgi:hypothetical protein